MAPRSHSLKTLIRMKIPNKRNDIQHICNVYGREILDKVTINHMFNGGFQMKSNYWEVSHLDSNFNLKFRGYSLEDLQDKLPKTSYNTNITPESMTWLLMSDSLPNETNIKHIQNELLFRSYLPDCIDEFIRDTCKKTDPLTTMTQALLMAKSQSRFSHAINKLDTKDDELWEYFYEDSIEIIATLPIIVASIYRKKYYDDNDPIVFSQHLDYTENFMRMMKLDSNKALTNYMRMYLGMHVDYAGGTASAQTSRMVSSTLSDPYSSLSASYMALSGNLHGSKGKEIMHHIIMIYQTLKKNNIEINKNSVKELIFEMAENNQYIPGFTCGYKSSNDMRYIIQDSIVQHKMYNDDILKITHYLEDCIQELYQRKNEDEKFKTIFAKSEVNSGALFMHYGIKDPEFHVTLLAMSRSIGLLSQMMWDKALLFPIHRSNSVDMNYMEEHFKKYLIKRLGYHLYK